MISKHSHEQSDRGEGVEVVQNEPYEDPNHGNGQLTEKRVYLNRQVHRTASLSMGSNKNLWWISVSGRSLSFSSRIGSHEQVRLPRRLRIDPCLKLRSVVLSSRVPFQRERILTRSLRCTENQNFCFLPLNCLSFCFPKLPTQNKQKTKMV